MIVRTLDAARRSERRVVTENWESARLLLKEDGMGFSFHVTTIYANTETEMRYANHLESVFCIAGRGELQNLEDGTTHAIEPGTIYLLDQHDHHVLRAFSEMTMACVFNPPLVGPEVHDATGAYPADIAETA